MARTIRRESRRSQRYAPSPGTLAALHHDRPEELAREVAHAALEPLVAVALEQRCAPEPGAVFVDPLRGRRYAYHVDECDRHGCEFVSIDEWRVRVGTPRAALVLDGGGRRYFAVDGWLGPMPFLGYVSAPGEDSVFDWADRLGIAEVKVDALSLQAGELW